MKIAEVLRQEIANRKKAEPVATKPKRYQVVIHSSPFLRCIQTAVGISAGLAQNPLPVPDCSHTNEDNHIFDTPVPEPHDESKGDKGKTGISNNSARLPPTFQKSILRLDACFGEWLSPEYFEMITHPPSSEMMLGIAKAELLRREDYKNNPHFHVHSQSISINSGRLWNSPFMQPENSAKVLDPMEDLSPLEVALPSKNESASEDFPKVTNCRNVDPLGYVPPFLGYSSSKNGPIPQGLVAHARDECLDIDYQWDSMRDPLNWGDGGLFGEEWTMMHKRFRKAIQSLVDWYTTCDNPGEMVTKVIKSPTVSSHTSEWAIDDEEYDTENFVVIVSHGAGCNALIGAITRKPVLMDVGQASLTLAVRQDEKLDNVLKASSKSSEGVVPVNDVYDMKLFANTDHIRSSSTTPSQSRSSSMANTLNGQRGRFPSNSFSTPTGNFSLMDSNSSRSSSANATFTSYHHSANHSSSIPRSPHVGAGSGGITVGSGVTTFTNNMTPSGLARSPSVGLWSPMRSLSRGSEANDEDGDSMVLNFAHEKSSFLGQNTPKEKDKGRPSPLSITSNSKDDAGTNPEAAISSEKKYAAELPSQDNLALGTGAGGLWGIPAPRPPGEAERMRDTSSTKRRWTVNERTTSR